MGPGAAAADREFGVVDPEAADDDAMPTVAPETGIEPDPEAAEERSQTWGPKAKGQPAGGQPSGGNQAGGA